VPAMQDLDALLKRVEAIARSHHQGHLSLFRFTAGWKAVFGTPQLEWSRDEESDYQRLFREPAFETLNEALEHLLQCWWASGQISRRTAPSAARSRQRTEVVRLDKKTPSPQ
jgi:hypothetical protein